MRNVKRIVALSLALIMAVMLAACTKDISKEIRTHFENNRYFYEEYTKENSSKNGTLTFTVNKHSLVLTSTISIAVKDGQISTYKRVLEAGIDASHTDYNELLNKLQTDVPEATFVVEFVDINRKLITQREYK